MRSAKTHMQTSVHPKTRGINQSELSNA